MSEYITELSSRNNSPEAGYVSTTGEAKGNCSSLETKQNITYRRQLKDKAGLITRAPLPWEFGKEHKQFRRRSAA